MDESVSPRTTAPPFRPGAFANSNFVPSVPPTRDSRVTSWSEDARRARARRVRSTHARRPARRNNTITVESEEADASVPHTPSPTTTVFSFGEFVPEHEDSAISGTLLGQMKSDISSESMPQKPSKIHARKEPKEKYSPPSLQELGFVVNDGNIIHHSYSKARIIRVKRRHAARMASIEGRIDVAQEQKIEEVKKKLEREVQKLVKAEVEKRTEDYIKARAESWARKGAHAAPGVEGANTSTRQSNTRVNELVMEIIKKEAEQHIVEQMEGPSGLELERRIRESVVPPPVPNSTISGEPDDLADYFAKLGLGSRGVNPGPIPTSAQHDGTFRHPEIDATRQRIAQSKPWTLDDSNIADQLLVHTEFINERFIRACVLDPNASCKGFILSNPRDAALHLAKIITKPSPEHVQQGIQELAHAAKTGVISNHYFDNIRGIAQAQTAAVSDLLSLEASTAMNTGVKLTPTELKVRNIMLKYRKLSRMNSKPLPLAPTRAL